MSRTQNARGIQILVGALNAMSFGRPERPKAKQRGKGHPTAKGNSKWHRRMVAAGLKPEVTS